ncbi:hypothetical protein SAMN05428957_102142 [Oryzisolibacter propanilivorax]|uniref:Uncharacterized protein n=1 Tax=Oryzisolibacter propanilivorax TaxID=1527607 RepID=A0A1G9Q9Q9_9BURK|nr:hypothetical protein [Oryzisolibacter propanilivorax]SDM07471.1 hypothetical protein SAMN05428957_102142 [Oryzisolibacter propanilivorax]
MATTLSRSFSAARLLGAGLLTAAAASAAHAAHPLVTDDSGT